ncbi:MAG TPA: ATP-dependent DNA helicase RecG [Bacteroidales bacterium]|nr:ATP-dependent DNA helicase RecG [Bacteroidales bacterium]
MQVNLLMTPIEFLKGVGPKRAAVLKKEFSIETYDDLLHYYPYRYVDKSKIYQIKEIQTEGAYMQFYGRVVRYEVVGQQRAKRLVALFEDKSGVIELVWFNGIRWIEQHLAEKREFIVFGRPTLFNHKWNITHPELIDPKTQSESPFPLKFYPLYNSSDKAKKSGMDSKAIAKLQLQLIPQVVDVVQETLSQEMLQKNNFLTMKQALVTIHFPENPEMLNRALLRLKFDELFFTQLRLLKLKLVTTQRVKGHLISKVGDYFNTFYHNYLPFELTNAQKRVIKEIRADMGSGRQMNRLLQGDVGSGKTITALFVMLLALDNDLQTCLMAPTEILALQHYESIRKFLKDMPLTVEFLSGSTRIAKRRVLLEKLKNGEIDILIGTHALIEDEVVFNNLGLVVIDEQHRFGVEQRAKLWRKNSIPPHILVMTATPIPRTLAMTLYGDLDISVINALPKGRKPIITRHFYDRDRLRVLDFMRNQIAEGRQVFVVYPLIKESEKMDLLDLMAGYDAMALEFPLPEYAISMVHGKMKVDEKEYEMQRFVKGETCIMLSTTVIEVGIDVPNATVMLVENAERFGLSQLHQLRGRVGRGGEQSYCILMSGNKLTTESKQRLSAMVNTNDGFEIANIDLRLRGPGDIQGTRQSGMLDFKIADLVKDEKIVSYTRRLAQELLQTDPELSQPQNLPIKKFLDQMLKEYVYYGMIS